MLDKALTHWWLSRIQSFREVSAEKLSAEREAMQRQQDYNRHYHDFMNQAVLPSIDELVKVLCQAQVVHRVATWGNQLALRIHLAWRWGELVITQSHEDCVGFEHHIITEGEKRGDDSAEDHTHTYDLRDPVPPFVATQELHFFLSRIAQDLVDEEGELPPGESADSD